MPRKRARDDNHGDLISGLPDEILRTIISLLPTREGADTQLVASSWRPLWRYAPLNICCDRLCRNQYKRISVVSKLLSIHHGTTRRLHLNPIRFRRDKKRFAEETAQLERWFRSRSLAKLEELDIGFEDRRYQLPSSVLLCASALVVAKISYCDFPKESLAPASLNNTMRTVKILALEFSVADLDATIGVLRCFPCIEKLYVNFMKWLNIPVNKHVHPTVPVKCPEINLKELVLNNYKGSEQDVCFAKFFVLNAQVLKKIRLGVIDEIYFRLKLETVSKEWMADQYRLLEVGTSASPDVQFVASTVGHNYMSLDAHDLSIADPFASSYSQME